MGSIETAPGQFLNTKFCVNLWTVRSATGITKIWVSIANGDALALPTAYKDSDAKQMQKDIQAILASW